MTLDKKMSLSCAKIGIYSAVIALTAIFILANCILPAAFPVYAENAEELIVPSIALVAFLAFATFELVKEIRLKKGLALGNDEDGVKTTTLLEDATATLISHFILRQAFTWQLKLSMQRAKEGFMQEKGRMKMVLSPVCGLLVHWGQASF